MPVSVALVFALLIAVAALFGCWPILRRTGTRAAARTLLAAAVAALILGIGGGVYLMLGSPYLAVRSVSPPSTTDLPALVAMLAQRVRERPDDPAGWTLLGHGYLTLNDPADAAAAFQRALAVARPAQRPALYSAYGESLARAAGGAVGPEAESAFAKALAVNPKDFAARYYLGRVYATRGDIKHAMALWQSLLADTPSGAPWRADLVDRIALLKAKGGGAPPDVGAMVAQLAARLRVHPEDPEGWLRLIRAYAVLGDSQKASAALASARSALKNDSAAIARLALEAKELKVQK